MLFEQRKCCSLWRKPGISPGYLFFSFECVSPLTNADRISVPVVLLASSRVLPINTAFWKMISYNCLANCSDAVNSFLTCFYQTDTRLNEQYLLWSDTRLNIKWTILTKPRFEMATGFTVVLHLLISSRKYPVTNRKHCSKELCVF